MKIIFVKNTSFNVDLLPKNAYGLYSSLLDNTTFIAKSTGYYYLRFKLVHVESKRDCVIVHLPMITTKVVNLESRAMEQMLVLGARDEQLLSTGVVDKNTVSRYKLSGVSSSPIKDYSYRYKARYTKDYTIGNCTKNLPVLNQPSCVEYLDIDLFIDENNNWYISPSGSNQYISAKRDGVPILNGVLVSGFPDIIVKVDLDNDLYFNTLYQAIISSFDLVKINK